MLRGSRWCIFIFYLSIIAKASADCGCSHATREERAKKYERSADPHNHETENVGRWTSAKDYEHMSLIPKGTFNIGTNDEVFKADKEGPEKEVEIKQFYIDKYQVSNEEFKKFTMATGYETEAEKFGDSFVFKIFLSAEAQKEHEDFRVVQGNK
jgi:sulfatase modifying factor 1